MLTIRKILLIILINLFMKLWRCHAVHCTGKCDEEESVVKSRALRSSLGNTILPLVAARSDEGKYYENSSDEISSQKKIRITKLPTNDIMGGDDGSINEKELRLCATISAEIYDTQISNACEFQERLLTKIPKEDYPNLDLDVRWFQKGITIKDVYNIPNIILNNPPTFAAVIIDSILILAWRGTTNIQDMVADAMFESKAPWSNIKALQVQRIYYDLIQYYFKCHQNDIINYINGNYDYYDTKPVSNKNHNYNSSRRLHQAAIMNDGIIKPKKNSSNITRIILTGHSLGGGLATVAHLYLTVPIHNNDNDAKSSKWQHNLATKIMEAKVDLRTVAFSAPMTTAVVPVVDENENNFAKEFFRKSMINSKIRNIIYSTDIVPRGYGNLEFIQDFVDKFLYQNDANKLSSVGSKSSIIAEKMAHAFARFMNSFLQQQKGLIAQAKRYQHIGKLIYYDNFKSEPIVYVDRGRPCDPNLEPGERSFYDLKYSYEPSQQNNSSTVADTAYNDHMILVKGPGLAYE